MVIDEDPVTCGKLLQKLGNRNIQVIQGDGTKATFLEDAEAAKADMLIAVTGFDENNLVACQMAKMKAENGFREEVVEKENGNQ